MSSLIFYIDNDAIYIGMDTLGVSADNKLPFNFSTKFFTLPHINTIICGTGLIDFFNHWGLIANCGTLADDIRQLDQQTPSSLRNLRASMNLEFTVERTATIYHFGLPSDGGPPCGFAYRSEKDFASEPLQSGALGVKPAGDIPENFIIPKDFATIMHSQRAKQKAVPKESRVFIGGEVLVCQLNRSGMFIYRAESFLDKQSDRAIMARRRKVDPFQ